MTGPNFMDLLQARWDEGKFVCIGLDSNVDKLPRLAQRTERPQYWFNTEIVKATADLVCAYKPNLAFYHGSQGKEVLAETIDMIRSVAPNVPVILDAKQGDIGKTNYGYIEEDFTYYNADAVTVHPYLGVKAMEPFLDRKDKGIFVLCRTSNVGADEFQDLLVSVTHDDHRGIGVTEKMPLYQMVARNVTKNWNYKRNCGVVVGATYPKELAEVRKIVGDMPILIPGIGTQGGDLKASVLAGKNSQGQGMIINSSSGIIFASKEDDFAEAARIETQKLHDDTTAVLATA